MEREGIVGREAKKETEKSVDTEVVFLSRCGSVNELMEMLSDVATAGRTETVMLDEFQLTVDQVVEGMERISDEARKRNIAIIMAPDIRRDGDRVRNNFDTWQEKKAELKDRGAVIMDDGIEKTDMADSVGMYFDPKGVVYAFPKSGKFHLHQIPGTRIGISICAELDDIEPEDLTQRDIDIIYNPSDWHDDNYLPYRMAGLRNPDIPDEELDALLARDEYYLKLDSLGVEDAEPPKDLDPEYHEAWLSVKIPAKSKEEVAAIKANYKEKMRDIVQNHGSDSSFYITKIRDILAKKNILVLRGDGDSTGILNPLPGLTVRDVEYTRDRARLAFSLGKM